MATPQSVLLLRKQLAELQKKPLDWFSAGLVDEDNIFKWEILIIGPTDSLYDGGYFKAHLTFPEDYPQKPPKMKFVSNIWHPNVGRDGSVCISILHEPGDDKYGYEKAAERWVPVHTVETIMFHLCLSPASLENGGDVMHRTIDYPDQLSETPLRHYCPIVSVISMLCDPNPESPANVDAAKEFRDDKQTFKKNVARCVRKSQEDLC